MHDSASRTGVSLDGVDDGELDQQAFSSFKIVPRRLPQSPSAYSNNEIPSKHIDRKIQQDTAMRRAVKSLECFNNVPAPLTNAILACYAYIHVPV